MKIVRIILTSLIAGVLIASPVSAAEGGWKKVSEWNGIAGYCRYTPFSKVSEIKAVGIVDAPLPVVEALLRDVPAQPQYMFMCAEATRVPIPGEENTVDNFCFYQRIDMPWPVSDRDFVARTSLMIDKDTGAIYGLARTIPASFRLSDDRVRVPLGIARNVLRPVGGNKTEVLYQAIADPGGHLPVALVNFMTNFTALKTIAKIRQLVKLDKYRNAQTVVTTTPYDPKLDWDK
ncbi:MAG: START domain-containing protein [Smithellaceae bacterium]|nr:START domain-containing protein [Smithellaceae bacterium]